jgi:hypothetical protein
MRARNLNHYHQNHAKHIEYQVGEIVIGIESDHVSRIARAVADVVEQRSHRFSSPHYQHLSSADCTSKLALLRDLVILGEDKPAKRVERTVQRSGLFHL